MKIKDLLITQISYIKKPSKRATIQMAKAFKGLEGIEVGGPSSSFGLKSFFPVYLYAKKIDGVNFSDETVWEGKIKEGNFYKYYDENNLGHQYIGEASELKAVPDNHYDFLLSCHSLEHIANPIKALKRWKEVLKKGAKICLILPDKRYTFDNKRPYTTFAHLLNDFKKDIDETDTTHFDEVNQLHDLEKDILQTRLALKERTADNIVNRCVHHHVFSFELINELLAYCGFEVLINKEFQPFHLLTLAEKI